MPLAFAILIFFKNFTAENNIINIIGSGHVNGRKVFVALFTLLFLRCSF